jgi:DUF4097 and DUF4098 domain-containing protein YvlB
VHLVRGDISAESVARDLSVMLVKGDVNISGGARVAVQAVSADVHVEGSRGDVAVNVIRGDVQVVQSAGSLTVSTKKGDIALGLNTAGQVNASTMKGDVRVRVREFAQGGSAEVHTVKGDVVLSLGAAARCRIDAAAVSGDVTFSVPLTDLSRDRHRLTGMLNAADARVEVRTTRGDIRIAPLEDDAAAPQAEPA